MNKFRFKIILLMILGLFIVSASYIYLNFLTPSKLTPSIINIINNQLGYDATIENAELVFIPSLSINIYTVDLSNSFSSIKVESASLTLSWKSLLFFKPEISYIEVINPNITIFLDQLPKKIEDFSKDETNKSLDFSALWGYDLPNTIKNLDFKIQNGHFLFIKDTKEFKVNDVNIEVSTPSLLDGYIDLSIAQVNLALKPDFSIFIEDFSLSFSNWKREFSTISGHLSVFANFQMDPLESILDREINDAYRYFPLSKPATLTLDTSIFLTHLEKRAFFDGTFVMSALFPVNGLDVPLYLEIPFSLSTTDEKPIFTQILLPADIPDVDDFIEQSSPIMPSNALDIKGFYVDTVNISNLIVKFDQDEVTANGKLRGLYPFNPILQGDFVAKRFSLPRWFDPVRGMSPGLLELTNNISGTSNFIVNLSGVAAYNLKISAMGLSLEGSGGCADYRNPHLVFRLDLVESEGRKGYVNLDPIFPEVNGIFLDDPEFPPAAVLETSDDKEKKLTYQIDINATNVDVWKLNVKDVFASIHTDENMSPAVDIMINDLYGGSAKAYLHLDDIYTLNGTIKKAHLKDAVTSIVTFPAFTGEISGVFASSFHGSKGKDFLENLKVKCNFTVLDGAVTTTSGHKTFFEKIVFSANIIGINSPSLRGRSLPDIVEYKGDWDISFKNKNYLIALNTNARIGFSTNNFLPTKIDEQHVLFSLNIPHKGLESINLQEDLDFTGSTNFSLNFSGPAYIYFNDMVLSNPIFDIYTNLHFNNIFVDTKIQASLNLMVNSFSEFTNLFGIELYTPKDPDVYKYLTFSGLVYSSKDLFKIDEINVQLDDMQITGNLIKPSAVEAWDAELVIKDLNMDKYWFKSTDSILLANTSPLPFDFIKSLKLNIDIAFEELMAFYVSFGSSKAQLILDDGYVLISTYNEFASATGIIQSLIEGTLIEETLPEETPQEDTPYFKTDIKFNISNVDLLPLAREREQDTLFSGTLNAQTTIAGNIAKIPDFAYNMNGTWSISLHEGSVINSNKEAVAIDKAKGPESFLAAPEVMPSSISTTVFQSIFASGTYDESLIHANEIQLVSPGFNAKGTGVVDILTQEIDANATIHFLGLADVPVNISGNINSPTIKTSLLTATTDTVGGLGMVTINLITQIIVAPIRFITGGRKVISTENP